SEVTAQLTEEERLTPLGKAYEEAVKVLEIFGYTVDWETFKGGAQGQVVAGTDGQPRMEKKFNIGNNITVVLDEDNRISKIGGLEFEWQDDGTAELSGYFIDENGVGEVVRSETGSARGVWVLEEGSLNPSEGSMYFRDRNGNTREVRVTIDGDSKTRTTTYNFSSETPIPEYGMWGVSSFEIQQKYTKDGDGWKLTELVDTFSDGEDTVKITYQIAEDGSCVTRVIEEGGVSATETILEGGDWLDYREKLMNGQVPGEMKIRIEGQRINPDTGEPEDVSGEYTRKVVPERVRGEDGNPQPTGKYYVFDVPTDENAGKDLDFYKEAVQIALSKIGLAPENDTELEQIAAALMDQGVEQAIQIAYQRFKDFLERKYQNAQIIQQIMQSEYGKKIEEAFRRLQAMFEYAKKGQVGNKYDPLTDRYMGNTKDDILKALSQVEESPIQLPEPGQQPGGARAGGGAPGQGGRQGQPGQGGGQTPPGGWTPYGGQGIPQIAQNRLFDPNEGIFGTDDPVERINRIYNRYPEVINQWAQAMGMSPEGWMNRFRNLTRDDARRRWLKEQNIKVTAQKLRTAYLKGLGLNDEQVSKVMSMLGDKEACINYLMQVLGISREEAEAIYNMLMSLGTEDGIRKYLEKLGYSEEEINAFIEKLNKMKEEKKQYLKELGLSDEEIEEILGMSKEEAEAKLKELGLTDEEIKDYFAKEEEIRQYLKEEMGIEDEAEIDNLLTLDEEQARAYLENRSLDIDIDEFLALETDEEKLDYLKNYFMNEKGMSEEEATQRAQEIMDKLNEIGETGNNQPDVEALQKYFNEHDININLDEFLALGSEEEMLNYLKDYFLNNEDLSEEESQARAEEVMNDIRDMLGGAQGIEDKILEMYNYLEENNYNTDEFLKELGFDYDKILEFRRLTEDHARYWFLTDTFENLIAQKNPDMSEEEVKEKAEWLAGLILG
ncbi:MAG: hypothetical protein DRP73_05185, partial [Candidatus Omnitrophota bacterium]